MRSLGLFLALLLVAPRALAVTYGECLHACAGDTACIAGCAGLAGAPDAVLSEEAIQQNWNSLVATGFADPGAPNECLPTQINVHPRAVQCRANCAKLPAELRAVCDGSCDSRFPPELPMHCKARE